MLWGLMVSSNAGMHLIIKAEMVMRAYKGIKCIKFDKPSYKVSQWVMFGLCSIRRGEICLWNNWIWMIPARVKSKTEGFNCFCCQLHELDPRGSIRKNHQKGHENMLKKVGCFKFFLFQISPCLICLSRINCLCFLILNVQRTWVTGDHSHHADHFWLQRKRMLFGWNNAPRLYLTLERSRDLLTQVAKNCKLGQSPWLSSCLLLSLSTSVFLISWDLNLCSFSWKE